MFLNCFLDLFLQSHGGTDRALLSFDLHVDLRPAFHWNIKQLFVFVVATYKTDTNPINEVVLWDKIVESIHPEDMVITEDNIIVKYALVDQGAELRGKEVELRLMWDHMPLTGGLFQDKSTNSSTFTLPSEYK
jgi:signal peptidase complex subunit 3